MRPLLAFAILMLSAGCQRTPEQQQADTLRNMPLVPDKSKASMRLNGTSAELHRSWYGGEVAKFFSFDEAPLAAAGGNVPLSPIYVTFNVNPDQPNGFFVGTTESTWLFGTAMKF